MHGDYDEPDASELGRTPFDWQAAVVVLLMVGMFVFSFLAGGGCAQGAEPPPQAPPVQAPPVVRSAPVPPKSAPTPPRLIGWNYTQPDGSVLFVPVQQPTPPGAMTIPAPGVAVPPPFAGGSGSTPTTPAITVGRPSTSSPDPVRLPGLIRIGVPGAAIRGFTDGCASPFG